MSEWTNEHQVRESVFVFFRPEFDEFIFNIVVPRSSRGGKHGPVSNNVPEVPIYVYAKLVILIQRLINLIPV